MKITSEELAKLAWDIEHNRVDVPGVSHAELCQSLGCGANKGYSILQALVKDYGWSVGFRMDDNITGVKIKRPVYCPPAKKGAKP